MRRLAAQRRDLSILRKMSCSFEMLRGHSACGRINKTFITSV